MATILRYKPWSMLRGIHDEVNQLFNQNLSESCVDKVCKWSPDVDIIEESDKFRLMADLPGVDPEAIKLNVEHDVLTIQGERKSLAKREKDGCFRVERSFGSFSRQFTLPDNVDATQIQAKTKHGVLEVTIPKLASSVPKSVEIKVEKEE